MKFFYKALLIFSGIIIVTALIGRFYIGYHSKELFQKIVSKVTHDKYRLEAKSIDFHFWNTGISGEKIKLIPNTNQQKQATLSLEKAEFRLHSLWHLIRNRSLEVKTIKIIRPDLTAWAKQNSGSDKKGISETFYEIQLKLFEIINVLKVEEVLMEDASLKIFTAGATDGSFLGINHLTLKLGNIQVLPSINPGMPNIQLDGSLTLLKPAIHLPNTNISAKLGKLDANLSNRSLNIDELDFSISNAANRRQKLILSTIRINKLNWERYLKEGVIELDTIYANKGFANINLLPKVDETPKGPVKEKAGYKGASVIIHHTIISGVAYNLNREKSKNGREKQVNLSLKGDNLYFEEFSLISGRQPVADVKKLAIALRDVKEGDNKGDVRFSLGALNLDSNNLVLKNYLLETNADNKNKNYLRVAVPEFRLVNYSLEEIFQKRIAATSIHLVNPDITFDIRQEKKKDKGSKKNLDAVFSDLMQTVSSKVALDEIAIENGNFTLLPTLSPEDRIKISGLSVIFDAGKFPQINDFHDFIHAIRRLDSKGFVLKGKNVDLTITDLKLLKIPRGIWFGSVKGNFGPGKNIDLKGLTVLINDSISNYRRTNDFHASAVLVDSGTVSLDLIKKDGSKKADGNALSLLIDTLDLNHVVFTMRQGKKTGISAALHIAAGNLIFRDKELYWNKLDVNATNPDAAFGNTVFKAGNMDIIQPGIIQIRNAAGHTSNPKANIDFKSEALNIKLGLNSTDLPALMVEDIEMTRPELNVFIRKQPKKPEFVAKQGKAIGKDILLKRLLMTEPAVNVTITDTAGKQTSWHKVYTGTFVLEDINTLTQPEIKVGGISYKTTDPKSEINGIKIYPSDLQVKLSRVKFNTISNTYSIRVDTVQVKNVSHTIYGKKQDTLQLDAGTIGMGGFDFAKGDSLSVDKLLYGTKWWLERANVQYRTPQKSMHAWKISASGKNTISIGLDSFAILNRQSRAEVWQSAPYEKGYETITGGKIRLADVRMQMTGKKPEVEISKMISENLHFTTSKDKTKPEDTVVYRALLTQMFTRIPMKIKMDSLLLNNARVDAHEISKKTGKETHIFFSEMNGYVKNVKTWDVREKDTLDMRVRARFFGTDILRLHFKQSYDDTLQGFWMRVRMSHFNMPEMNQLLTPLMGLKIHSGTIDSLLLVANGNDFFAYGTMDLRFHNLHAKLLKTEETKGKFLISVGNFFAGFLIPKHDNGRTNLLFKERLRKKSIFNFWAKIGLEGLLTNLGIKRDKKERKQFQKTIEKFNLPEKYWDEIDDL